MRCVSAMIVLLTTVPVFAAETKVERDTTYTEPADEPYDFDRIYGAWWGKVVFADAKATVHRSADRYIQAVQGD